MKKILVLVIALLVVGLAVVSAQTQPVPKLPTPDFVTTLGRNPSNSPLSQAQLQRLFELRDQFKYDQYLFNGGFITRDEFRQRGEQFQLADYEIHQNASGTGRVLDEIEEAINKLWRQWSPGWASAQMMRDMIGFSIPQPAGTRATAYNERALIRAYLTPYSAATFNTLKQQIEAALGQPLVQNPDPEMTHLWRQIIPSSRSADGTPYYIQISLYESENRIYFEVAGLTREPTSPW